MSLASSELAKQLRHRAGELPAAPRGLLAEFDKLVHEISEIGRYIVRIFPQYTPHDPAGHLDHLFDLADRVLGAPLYSRLNTAELITLAFALYAHDWGMALSEREIEILQGIMQPDAAFVGLEGEPGICQRFLTSATAAGQEVSAALANYIRQTHGLRSGARLRSRLAPLGTVFAESVAAVAEGHMLDARVILDEARYPLTRSVFGMIVNVRALASYVRVVDLLDIGDDRTPFALWKFVQPSNQVSSMEWAKHRALSPIAVQLLSTGQRHVVISGTTDDYRVYAALADLRAWIDGQFGESLRLASSAGARYDLHLDSRIDWNVLTRGFEPLLARFETKREAVLSLLAVDLYGEQRYAFVRELLQNSVDAIDTREALLRRPNIDVHLEGRIVIGISRDDGGMITLDWRDNGIGMNKDVLLNYFVVAGQSWYRSEEFRRADVAVEPISRFGVGILSCFAFSDCLFVETKQDPYWSGHTDGYAIEIPDRRSHFRVRQDGNLPVGTLIQLRIPKKAGFSIDSFCRQVERFAGFIRHKIILNVLGRSREVPSLGRAEGGDTAKVQNMASLPVQSRLSDDRAARLLSNARVIDLSIGAPEDDFEGFYSALLPSTRNATLITNWTWQIAGNKIDITEFAKANSGVYVKGVLVQATSREFKSHEELTGSQSSSDWLGPRVLVNLKRPSMLRFNLARTSAHNDDDRWQPAVWKAIAHGLRKAAFADVLTPLDAAWAVGAASVFGGVPRWALTDLVSVDELPVLMLIPGTGPDWKFLRKEAAADRRIVEAPYQLYYSLTEDVVLGDNPSKLGGWAGKSAMLTITPHGSYGRKCLWISAASQIASRALKSWGYRPHRIVAVRGGAGRTFPLFCRIWEKPLDDRVLTMPTSAASEYAQGDWRSRQENDGLWNEAPQILRFPSSLRNVAAIGSRYWNADHPKIQEIFEVLRRLVSRVRQGEASGETMDRFNYFSGTDYLGFVAPSCQAGGRAAKGVVEELARLAVAEGLARRMICLDDSDFLPGSVGTYENPYHYKAMGWKDVGEQLDDE